MTPREMTKTVVDALDAKQARDIRVLEVGSLTVLSDFFVLATATSSTQVKTLIGECERVLKERGVAAHHIEGHHAGSWVLMDFGCLVVHIFLQETRAFYALERLWADAKVWDPAEL